MADNDPVTVNGVTVTIEDAAAFAPVVQFHPGERYWPCSIEFLLANAVLFVGDDPITFEPTAEDLYAYRSTPAAHLEILPEGRNGLPPAANHVFAPMYVAPQVAPDGSFVDLNYMHLYAFNGPQCMFADVSGGVPIGDFYCALPSYATHDGDVEVCTVRVTPDFQKILHVSVSAHGDITWYLADELDYEGGTHAVVRSGLFSHALRNPRDRTLWVPGERDAVSTEVEDVEAAELHFIDDITQGPVTWAPPADQLVFVGFDGDVDAPINGQRWTSFAGRLGARWTNDLEDVIGIRGSITSAQEAAVRGGEWFGDWQEMIADDLREANGTEGFGARADQMMIGDPVDLETMTAVVVSRHSPVYGLSVPPTDAKGNLVLSPMALGTPIDVDHTWRLTSHDEAADRYLIANVGTDLLAHANLVGNTVEQIDPDEADAWTKFIAPGREGTAGATGLGLIAEQRGGERWYVDVPGTDYLGLPVRVKWQGDGDPEGRWGIVPIQPGLSRLGLVGVYRGSESNQLWWTAGDTRTGAWMPDAITGHMTSSSGPALAVLDQTLFLVFRGENDQLYWTAWDGEGAEWQPPRSFGRGMATSDGPALAVLDDVLYCVHRGTNNLLYWTRYDPESNTWMLNEKIGPGIITKRPPALAAFQGRLYCVYSALGDPLMWMSFDPVDGWQPARYFGQDMMARGAALADTGGALMCVHLGTDHNMWWTMFDPSDSTWDKDQQFGLGVRSMSLRPPRLVLSGATLLCIYRGYMDENLWVATYDNLGRAWTGPRKVDFDCRSQDSPGFAALPMGPPPTGS
jgi:hypothetical protein